MLVLDADKVQGAKEQSERGFHVVLEIDKLI